MYVAIRVILRIFGIGASRNKKRQYNRNQNGQAQAKERHKQGDVIIEYNKPPKKKPRLDADDVEYEVIE